VLETVTVLPSKNRPARSHGNGRVVVGAIEHKYFETLLMTDTADNSDWLPLINLYWPRI